ncbi:hypothetical protein MASR1M60_13280 [Rhodocyclaceae bacterium]
MEDVALSSTRRDAVPTEQGNNDPDFTKRLRGQFFTTTNPFVCEAFVRWMKTINKNGLPAILEPFAGSNNIVWMVRELGFQNEWTSFDIDPPEENMAEDVPVRQQDTLEKYPAGFKVAITNPPYLAKNSATCRGMAYAGGDFEDLYQMALSVMLANTDHVAAIIPETFVKQGLFHDRLVAVVSLTCQMFDDTCHPVCLALFSPASDKRQPSDFEIWQGNRLVGTFEKLKKFMQPPPIRLPWKFNDPDGLIGLKGADGSKKADVAFVMGSEIPSEAVKGSSRHNTRISLEGLTAKDAKKVIAKANKLLAELRKHTKDVFLTAHRGLREDGRYRRRLEYSQARDILTSACIELNLFCQQEEK